MKPFEELTITVRAQMNLAAHCLNASAIEQVGVLLGRGSSIEDVCPLPNHATGPDKFLIRAADLSAAKATAADAGQRVLGRYHTHLPARPFPSHADRHSLPDGWLEMIVCVGRRGGQRMITDTRVFDSIGGRVPLILPALSEAPA